MSPSPLSTPHSPALRFDDGSAKRRRLLPQPPSEGKGLEKSMDSPNKLSLPDDIVYEILLRLPVKSLVRFKCVCKSWFSLFSDPNFAKSHFDQSLAPTQRFLYIPKHGFNSHSIDIDASFHREFTSMPIPNPSSEVGLANCCSVTVRCTCRGLVLLSKAIRSGCTNLLLWNPSTGSYKGMPYPSNASKFPHLSGLLYDEETDDYLVVMISMERLSQADTKFYLEFFSVRKNSWEVIQLQHPPFPKLVTFSILRMRSNWGLLFNGVIHWNLYKEIVCFDMRQRRFSVMSTPHRNRHLLEVGGCLAAYDGYSDIWVMKDYKVQSSWTKYCRVPKNVVPICVKKNKEMIGVHCELLENTKLARFNHRRKLLESSKCCPEVHLFGRAVYMETLFSPSCHIDNRVETHPKNPSNREQGPKDIEQPNSTLKVYQRRKKKNNSAA